MKTIIINPVNNHRVSRKIAFIKWIREASDIIYGYTIGLREAKLIVENICLYGRSLVVEAYNESQIDNVEGSFALLFLYDDFAIVSSTNNECLFLKDYIPPSHWIEEKEDEKLGEELEKSFEEEDKTILGVDIDGKEIYPGDLILCQREDGYARIYSLTNEIVIATKTKSDPLNNSDANVGIITFKKRINNSSSGICIYSDKPAFTMSVDALAEFKKIGHAIDLMKGFE